VGGRTPNELVQEFGPTAESIRDWVKQAEILSQIFEFVKARQGQYPITTRP
jgi:hypothetical protein